MTLWVVWAQTEQQASNEMHQECSLDTIRPQKRARDPASLEETTDLITQANQSTKTLSHQTSVRLLILMWWRAQVRFRPGVTLACASREWWLEWMCKPVSIAKIQTDPLSICLLKENLECKEMGPWPLANSKQHRHGPKLVPITNISSKLNCSATNLQLLSSLTSQDKIR